MDLHLQGKRALVTGGSRGIGRAIALALAAQGVAVAVCYQQESDAIRSLADELRHLNAESFVVQADVSNEADVAHLANEVRRCFDRIHVVVNNAGVVSHATLDTMTMAEWRRVLDTNLTSMYLVTQATQDMLPEGSSIINIASAVATVGMPGRTHYTASKAGVVGFTRSLCKEMGPQGIRVNAIAPGIIDTDQASGLTPEQRARYAAMAALGRLGQSTDIAQVALFLASDLSRFVSGITINVDGGI
ncbi:short-chain dehydrogenase [Ktedonobacter sp. SOSP1-52]|uniref:SDR family NAD(P)-dependent oxidoreductase n=1 Tax=Ktedonobacter sp. SOSP1-52 TaxID=2778366 RepID=UPI0019160841|nr:3-oxoacyl-ACP reductase family protein [Ktedonobacter sp. SOSP1-52]GHO65449.1 short-chain dehydrogenase [Ktedonobacter sp. SOSP1-52]